MTPVAEGARASAPPPARRGPEVVAAVDCGTNSTRLLVLDAAGTVLERHMRVTRLGEGVDATHTLAPAAVERTAAVLEDYRRIMDARGVRRVRVVATSAARDATNAAEFLARAEQATGAVPEILAGDEEGRLSFAGATAHLPAGFEGPGPVLVVDIGGGSTELVAGDAAHARGAGVERDPVAVSLDVGCVRITERFLHHDPPLPAELEAAREELRVQLDAARVRLPPLTAGGPLVGLAGTVSTLAALVHGLAEYERARVHHVVLGGDEVAHWLAVLAAEPARARRRRTGMLEGRADVIVGGVLVLAAVMDRFDRTRCLVSEDDILNGLADDLLRSRG